MKYSQEFYDLMHDVKMVRARLHRLSSEINVVTDDYVMGKVCTLDTAIHYLDELIKKWEA